MFNPDDMRHKISCSCCGAVIRDDLYQRHMGLLGRLCAELGYPVLINSGHRCRKHNKEVGGAAGSWHLRFATDVRPGDNDYTKINMIASAAKEIGFTGIGIARTFVHLDLRDKPYEWRYA